MKPFSALCLTFLLPCFLIQEASCFMRQKKISEFQAKLQGISSSTLTPTPLPSQSPAPPSIKRNGRVFYPIGYGADPTGEIESNDNILEALNDAFQVQKGIEMLPGVNDLGGVIIDLQGGNYKISKPITFPSSGGANVVVQGGTLRASDTFPDDQHLIELFSTRSQKLKKLDYGHHDSLSGMKLQNENIYYEDITFRDIVFDSSYHGGGLFIIDSARIRITNCFFLHFTTEGILVQKGHETFISSCFLGQHSTVGGDKGEKFFSGTAIDLASNDNAITDVAIFSAAIGVLLRGQANILTGVHCYNKATYFGGIGILVKLGSALNRIDNCYLDYNAVVMEDPIQVHVTNGFFLGDDNIVLRSINGSISGINIVDNMFNGIPEYMVPRIKLDGEYNSIDQVVIERNNVNGMSLKSTIGKLSVAGTGTKWVADFSPILVFPNRITHFQYSLYSVEGGELDIGHSVTNVSNNVVVVESNKPLNGVVSVIVDQYNMLGEGKSFM